MLGCPGGSAVECFALGPGRDPGVPGSHPVSGSPHGACFSLCVCLCLSLSVSLSLMNKYIKIFKKSKKARPLPHIIYKNKMEFRHPEWGALTRYPLLQFEDPSRKKHTLHFLTGKSLFYYPSRRKEDCLLAQEHPSH